MGREAVSFVKTGYPSNPELGKWMETIVSLGYTWLVEYVEILRLENYLTSSLFVVDALSYLGPCRVRNEFHCLVDL